VKIGEPGKGMRRGEGTVMMMMMMMMMVVVRAARERAA
jgi:hypothetical protein